MHVFWLLGTFFGLTVTTAGGIMVNHYVSTNANIHCCVFSVVFMTLQNVQL